MTTNKSIKKPSTVTVTARISQETNEKLNQLKELSNRSLGNLLDELIKEVELKKY
jgi:hypothetical protein